ncbi:hypothetical protein T552_01214 [Pneumocystis carinii B80]|uniref:t-SNARE coiled-coil homology domain-containing protein n=1 Tax=Pneumocystis carinii (strain B80) TaxID=1408658 RepID=A0A0W4ZLK5_PNEC8|nr:hypothetical protein T552_01214 [Pneumocystis carinii B80]KTW29259.1 hypothetical protein T552_01214 [Pneumocystis carinii B80]
MENNYLRSNTSNKSVYGGENSSFSENSHSSLRNAGLFESNDTYEQARSKLFEMSPPKYEQHSFNNKYTSNTNNSRMFSSNDQYTPYNIAESDNEDVDAIKQEMRFVKQNSVSSTRNAIRTAIQAEEMGRQTLERLGTQSEKIGSTEKHLDLATVSAKMAEDKNKKLNQLNRSVFIPHFSNPWKKQTRLKEREQYIRDQYELEEKERERTKRSDSESNRRINDALYRQKTRSFGKQSLNDSMRYRFEPDEEDDDLENEIDQNLAQLGNITAQLKAIATATQEEILCQNERLDRISDKGHKLNAEIYVNAERLKRMN